MNIGIVGLGKMGEAIAYRLGQGGHNVVGYDPNVKARQAAEKISVTMVNSLAQLAEAVRVVWLMLPAGQIIDKVIQELLPDLKPGDIIIDGGNSKYIDSRRRAHDLSEHGIFFLDCGTSGGLLGREQGFSLMVGGDNAIYTKLRPIFEAIAADGGLAHVGPSGAGHYVKMVHNGIEYALLQAYAEGFYLMKDGTFKDVALDFEEISRIWQHGAVIRSWLLDLAHDVFSEDQELKNISGEVAEGGTGRWTVEEAHQNSIPVPLIEKSLEIRQWSRETGGNYATKVVAMLRNKFGGHTVKKV